MTDIAVSPFVKRQTRDSRFSHFEGDWERLRQLVVEHFGQAKSGYRVGVVLVPVPPEGFFSSVVLLREGDKLSGTFEARQPGEDPRKSIGVVAREGQSKLPAKGVDIILYRHDVLAENNEHSCDAEWEIISVNARPTEEEMPMQPATMMANHFELSGGTATGLSDGEFVRQLREAVLYWKDKAMLLPAE